MTSNPTPEAALSELTHPPVPEMVFRVGVVGHRPNRLQQMDEERLRQSLSLLLQTVQQEVEAMRQQLHRLYQDKASRMRAISPLAEGVDRIFADQALPLGYELCCVLPFHKEEYAKDFAPGVALEADSLDRFQTLYDQAAVHFEMDGQRSEVQSPVAYGVAGQVVLNQSDLLIVVWDGNTESKRGGTEEVFQSAHRQGIPLVWVDACAPHAWQCIEAGDHLPTFHADTRAQPNQGTSEDIRKLVRDALKLPDCKTGRDNHDAIQRFYAETKPRWTSAVVWPLFQNWLGLGKWNRPRGRVQPFETSLLHEWPRENRTALGWSINRLRPYYAWADKLSQLYGDRYRSAFLVAFMAAAFSVAMALLPTLSPGISEKASTLAELLAIFLILFLVGVGRRNEWHARWLDYRFVSELVRHLRLVTPLGGQRPYAQLPAHLASYGSPSASWMDWYVRAVARQVGLPNARMEPAHIRNCLEHLCELLTGQIQYHQTAAKRSHHIEARLHGTGLLLLGLTLVACVLHLLHILLPAHVLTFICGVFPALGAALAGIENQGEFRRVVRRSNAMIAPLERLRTRAQALMKDLDNAPEANAYAVSASALSSEAANLLVAEVLDWRVVFLDRPIEQAAQ